MSNVTVEEVSGWRGIREFVGVPWRLFHYKNDPHWVPPLRVENYVRISPRLNPFHKHAKVKYLIARRNGEPVGRISSHISFRYNEFHDSNEGFFGWFECEDDPETARALLEAAEQKQREWGTNAILGPFNYTVNNECGLLVDGFDTPPMLLMTHNPPYYQKLIENCAYEKAHDLFAYRMDTSQPVPELIAKIAEQIRARPDVKFRKWDIKHNLRRELEIFFDIYNSAWNRNWGFAPLEKDELMSYEHEFKYLLDEDIAFMAEIDGKPAGFSLSLPNLNEAIIHMNGKLNPLTIWKFLKEKKRVNSVRVFALGVKPEYRRIGIGAVFYADTLLVARARGYKWGEMSWILESNKNMNKAIQTMGGWVYKTYRIYRKELAGVAAE